MLNFLALIKTKALQLGSAQTIAKYLKNTFWLMFERVLPMGVAFVVGVFVARYFGPEKLGLLDYGRSIAMFFITFASLNLEIFLVKKLVQEKEREFEYLGTSLALRISASLVVIGIVLLLQAFQFFDDDIIFYIVLLVTSASLTGSFDILKSYFQSKVISQKIAMATTVQIVVSSILRIYFVIGEYHLLYFAGVYLIEALILSLGLLLAYKKGGGTFLKWKFKPSLAFSSLKEWWPMVISGLLIIIYMRVDQIMIKWLLDAQSVGYYSAAVRISEIWVFLGTVLCNAFFPALVKMKMENQKAYWKGLNSLLSLVVIVAFVIIVPISFFSGTIMNFLYGSEFAPSGNVLAIHAWSLLFIFIGMVGGRWLINENLQKLSLYHTTVGLIVNIILNYIFIPVYGIEGAAITTLISQMVASYWGNLFYRKARVLFIAQTKALFFIHVTSLFFSKRD